MANDKYQLQTEKALDYSDSWVAITPDDNVDLPNGAPKFIMVGATGGTITCLDRSGNSATFQVAAGGRLLGPRPHRVKATGTTATPIYACY